MSRAYVNVVELLLGYEKNGKLYAGFVVHELENPKWDTVSEVSYPGYRRVPVDIKSGEVSINLPSEADGIMVAGMALFDTEEVNSGELLFYKGHYSGSPFSLPGSGTVTLQFGNI